MELYQDLVIFNTDINKISNICLQTNTVYLIFHFLRNGFVIFGVKFKWVHNAPINHDIGWIESDFIKCKYMIYFTSPLIWYNYTVVQNIWIVAHGQGLLKEGPANLKRRESFVSADQILQSTRINKVNSYKIMCIITYIDADHLCRLLQNQINYIFLIFWWNFIFHFNIFNCLKHKLL